MIITVNQFELCRNDLSQNVIFTRKDMSAKVCKQLEIEGCPTGLGKNSRAYSVNNSNTLTPQFQVQYCFITVFQFELWQFSSWWTPGYWQILHFLGACCQSWRLELTVVLVGRAGTRIQVTSTWMLEGMGCFVDCCCYWCCCHREQQACKHLNKWRVSLIVKTLH